ncbi:hypothetical protein FB567DRAFT_526718 [Paraphoma chrysanthemicola]|uniref:Uncharacterized protein n=1 Tax=Paraphoma chrysanthemicola TaxID=798071 RepID=A0A8K0R6V5_9PLEO|nr:hypothetical protein FB567DRAFT_526718 [Paraphoma chrysanthemicola]
MAVQSVLSPTKTPMDIATVSLFQMFGGSLLAALSQTIPNEQLVKELTRNVPNIDIRAILAAGAIGSPKLIGPAQLTSVMKSYNFAIVDTFYLAGAVTTMSFIVALGLLWISMEGNAVAREEGP